MPPAISYSTWELVLHNISISLRSKYVFVFTVYLPSLTGMTLSSIKSFMLELDGPADAAFTGGEVVSGQVVLELRRDTRVHSMKVQGRGVATAHWLENRGMNSVYNDYTSKITYFRKRQHLIRGQWWKLQMLLVAWMVNIQCVYLSDWFFSYGFVVEICNDSR